MNNKQLLKILSDYDAHCKAIIKSTKVEINESPAQRKKRISALERDYIKWFEYYLPHYAKAPSSWYHKKVANLLINNDIIYIIQRIFRGGAKSVHANVGIPLFLYLAKNDMKFMLLIGENETKAKKLLSDIQAELEANERLKFDYGARLKVGNWADGNFTTTDGTHFFALGIGQSPRGVREMENRPDYISVDDADTKKRSKNPKLVKELFDYLKEDIMGTFGKEKRRYVQSNNRFSKNTCVHLMSEHFEYINRERRLKKLPIYHHIIIAKAIMDNGKSGWPEYYSLEDWEAIRLERGELSFQREYQDNPIEEGKVFKNEWIHYKHRLRLDQYDSLVFYGDLSYKDSGDYKALLFVGKKGKEFHVIKAFVRRTSRANAAKWLYDTYEELNLAKYPVSYKIEGLFAQDEFVNDFDEEGDKRGYHIPVVADKKPKANKYERIETMSGFFERGNVFFNLVEKDTNDFKTLESQLLAFEKGSNVNDDGPDALQSAISELNGIRTLNANNVRVTSRKELINRRKNRF